MQIKTANGKKKVVISRREWELIGKKAGWQAFDQDPGGEPVPEVWVAQVPGAENPESDPARALKKFWNKAKVRINVSDIKEALREEALYRGNNGIYFDADLSVLGESVGILEEIYVIWEEARKGELDYFWDALEAGDIAKMQDLVGNSKNPSQFNASKSGKALVMDLAETTDPKKFEFTAVVAKMLIDAGVDFGFGFGGWGSKATNIAQKNENNPLYNVLYSEQKRLEDAERAKNLEDMGNEAAKSWSSQSEDVKEVARTAAAWWSNFLKPSSGDERIHDAGDEEMEGFADQMLGKKHLSDAEAQGFEDTLAALLSMVRDRRVKSDYQGGNPTSDLSVDYGPTGLLYDAIRMMNINTDYISLPWKTDMRISWNTGEITVSKGYGAEREVIRAGTETSAGTKLQSGRTSGFFGNLLPHL